MLPVLLLLCFYCLEWVRSLHERLSDTHITWPALGTMKFDLNVGNILCALYCSKLTWSPITNYPTIRKQRVTLTNWVQRSFKRLATQFQILTRGKWNIQLVFGRLPVYLIFSSLIKVCPDAMDGNTIWVLEWRFLLTTVLMMLPFTWNKYAFCTERAQHKLLFAQLILFVFWVQLVVTTKSLEITCNKLLCSQAERINKTGLFTWHWNWNGWLI